MSKKITKPTPIKPPLAAKTKSSLFDRWEESLKKNQTKFLFITLGISLLFSALLFDVKISELNDDSLYIEGGFNFAEDIHHAFTANAPLYPLILSIPIKLFGINLILLKSISVLFTLLHLWFLFLAFRNRIPYLVIFPVLFILSVNSFIHYFASLTFTESLYLFLQAVFLYVFFRVYDKTKDNKSIKDNWYQWLIVGVFLFLLNFCKNIAVGAAAAVIVALLLNRKWMHSLYALAGVLLIRIPSDMLRTAFWGVDQFSSQSGILRQVDPYNPSKGLETTAGFVQRFIDNTNLYIGKRLYQIFGFVSPENTETKAGLVFFTAVFFIIALVAIIRNKNFYMQFIMLYSLTMMALTFIVLQKQWDQPRMVLVYTPYILLIFFYGIYHLVKKGAAQFVYIILAFILISSSLLSSMGKASANIPRLQKNLKGDLLYGYTEDWVNFLKMSLYCADSLPPTSYVVSRKAPMSFVYSKGKRFYPVYTVFSDDPDTVLATLQREKVTHVIIASLRRNPKKIDGYTINTINRLLQPIAVKYPQKLRLVKQIGESEPAYLYEINY